MNQLKEIAMVFFKLGLIAFGGPAAHIAMMQEEIVDKRKWISREHFLDLMGATNLIPGPNSTEMTMHCGHERGGWKGLFVAGISFIFPAVTLTCFLAYLYVEYGHLPHIEPFITGIKPAVLAIILGAVYKLGKKAAKSNELIILGVLVLFGAIYGFSEIIMLLAGGLVGMLYFSWAKSDGIKKSNILLLAPATLLSKAAGTIGSVNIFWSFLKVGSILYGSGYVLFAYLDAELVSNGWLTRTELVEAIAVGQFTPGPVLSTATFIGYQMNGLSGAMAATLGIFLPSFLFVWLLNPLVPKMRKSKPLGYFLDAVNISAVAVMLAVLVDMGREVIVDWRTLLIAIVGIFLQFYVKKANAMWIVLIGAILGFFLSQIG